MSAPPDDLTTLPARTRRASARLAAACLALVVILPLIVAGYWLCADAGTLAVRANLPPGAPFGDPALWQRGVGALLTEIPVALLLAGVWQARRCFLLFAEGTAFTARAVACLRRFAFWAMLSVVADVVTHTLASMVITAHNPPGLRYLAVGVGTDQIMLLFFAAMVWLMAAVISRAEALADENARFV